MTDTMAAMCDANLTSERLRNHLDSNQPSRERLCLALLPLLGPFSQERPRRPRGGPDGGRDIEAIHDGQLEVWGAVGFKNGGGADEAARKNAQKKFRDDLNRALKENPGLHGFVFFTNVDFTPGMVEALKASGYESGIDFVEIFDFERIRHVLDQPEGLIPRLQFLGIPMSATEQLGLIDKFGNQLQNAVLSRFDRVEKSLRLVENFLTYQKPVTRIDHYISIIEDWVSTDMANEQALVIVEGMPFPDSKIFFDLSNVQDHDLSKSDLVMKSRVSGTHGFTMDHEFVSLGRSKEFRSHCSVSFSRGGMASKIDDMHEVVVSVLFTEELLSIADRIVIEINGLELMNESVNQIGFETKFDVEQLPSAVRDVRMIAGIRQYTRHLVFEPLLPSGRFFKLKHANQK